jgi:hypothetical protein
MRRLIERLAGPERAVRNARTACTELSRRRLERDEVELFLEGLDARSRRSA